MSILAASLIWRREIPGEIGAVTGLGSQGKPAQPRPIPMCAAQANPGSTHALGPAFPTPLQEQGALPPPLGALHVAGRAGLGWIGAAAGQDDEPDHGAPHSAAHRGCVHCGFAGGECAAPQRTGGRGRLCSRPSPTTYPFSHFFQRPPTAPASGSEPPCSGRAVSTSGRALSFLLRCFSAFALAFRATVPLSVPARSSLPSSPVSCLAASVPSLPSVFGLRLPVCHPSQSPGLSQPTALPLSCPASCLGKTDSRLLEYHSLTPQMPSLSSLPLPCGWVLSAPARLPFPGLGCGEVGERIRKKPRPLLERNILISPRLGALLESCLK